jgi:hypothetical protein
MVNLNSDEQQVYDAIVYCDKRITQLEIAKKVFVGSHEVHENYKASESTLRKVRQIIRDLRIKHCLQILSDANGYWIMNDIEEAKKYLNRIEQTAKAQAKAWVITYNSMKRNFGIKNEYFEAQTKLFN